MISHFLKSRLLQKSIFSLNINLFNIEPNLDIFLGHITIYWSSITKKYLIFKLLRNFYQQNRVIADCHWL